MNDHGAVGALVAAQHAQQRSPPAFRLCSLADPGAANELKEVHRQHKGHQPEGDHCRPAVQPSPKRKGYPDQRDQERLPQQAP